MRSPSTLRRHWARWAERPDPSSSLLGRPGRRPPHPSRSGRCGTPGSGGRIAGGRPHRVAGVVSAPARARRPQRDNNRNVHRVMARRVRPGRVSSRADATGRCRPPGTASRTPRNAFSEYAPPRWAAHEASVTAAGDSGPLSPALARSRRGPAAASTRACVRPPVRTPAHRLRRRHASAGANVLWCRGFDPSSGAKGEVILKRVAGPATDACVFRWPASRWRRPR